MSHETQKIESTKVEISCSSRLLLRSSVFWLFHGFSVSKMPSASCQMRGWSFFLPHGQEWLDLDRWSNECLLEARTTWPVDRKNLLRSAQELAMKCKASVLCYYLSISIFIFTYIYLHIYILGIKFIEFWLSNVFFMLRTARKKCHFPKTAHSSSSFSPFFPKKLIVELNVGPPSKAGWWWNIRKRPAYTLMKQNSLN